MHAPEKKYFQISSLEKGIKVIELLAEKEELTVSPQVPPTLTPTNESD